METPHPSKVYSPNPKTTRSFASPFTCSKDGKWLMYSIKKNSNPP